MCSHGRIPTVPLEVLKGSHYLSSIGPTFLIQVIQMIKWLQKVQNSSGEVPGRVPGYSFLSYQASGDHGSWLKCFFALIME